MTAYYDGIEFKTGLLARWAAFFDLAGWEWHCNAAAVTDWVPDFRVRFPCGHSECGGSHTLLVSVLDVGELTRLSGHPALRYAYGVGESGALRADAGALFGREPRVSLWEMAHGAGGGVGTVTEWVLEHAVFWHQAEGRVVRASVEIP